MSIKVLIAGLALLALSACVSTTSYQAKEAGLQLTVNKDSAVSVDKGDSHTYNTTSFGQYFFKLSDGGAQTMYGLLPLKFNGGYLAMDILFFAPAMFYDLREVFPYYQFDIKDGIVQYKKKPQDNWVTHKSTPAEIERAKRYFNKMGEANSSMVTSTN